MFNLFCQLAHRLTGTVRQDGTRLNPHAIHVLVRRGMRVVVAVGISHLARQVAAEAIQDQGLLEWAVAATAVA